MFFNEILMVRASLVGDARAKDREVSTSNESLGAVHLDMITHMLNQGGGAHKALDREFMYQEAQHQVTEEASKLVSVKQKAGVELDAFLKDSRLMSIGFPPMERTYRYLIHESAMERGLVSYSVGEEEHGRHTIVWKKHAAPKEEDLKRVGAQTEVRPDKQVEGAPF